MTTKIGDVIQSGESGESDRFMMATTAVHKLADISRDEPSLAIIYGEDGTDFIGEWVTGAGFINVRFPKATTRELTAGERSEYNGKFIDTAGYVRPIVIAEPDPPADTSTLLDLVRQYGSQRYMHGLDLGAALPATQGHEAASEALLDRIAALVPQLPVQARSLRGRPMWQHGCDAIDECDFQPSPDHCPRGPWRPLLVGDIPAPEETDDRIALDHVRKVRDSFRRQRDEARARVKLLEADLEALAEERQQAAQPGPLVLSLPRVPEGATLRGVQTGKLYDWDDEGHGWRCGRWIGSLGELLSLREPVGVRVEMAPPREPRTWKVITALSDDLRKVEVQGHGTWFRYQHRDTDIWHQGDGSARVLFSTLLALGDVTEVFDDEPGGQQ